MNEPLRILDAGDAALTIEFGSVIDPALLAAVNALDAAIARARRAGALPGVIETMPTFRSPTVFFDPLATERDTLLAALQPLIDAAEHGTPVDGRDEDAPVIECFDGGLHLVAHGGAVTAAEGARIARAAEAETRALIETLVWSTSASAVASGAIRQTAPKKARPRSKMNFSLRPPASARPRSARDVFHPRAWRITSPFVRREQFAMGDQTEDRSTRSMASQPYRARLPGFIVDEEIGLGDVLKRVTYRIGIEPCGGCRQRAAALNRWMVFAPPSRKS